MEFIRRLLRRRSYTDEQRRQAATLVAEARRYAMASYPRLAHDFPDDMRVIRAQYDRFDEFMDYWDRFVTVVVVGAAYSMMTDLPGQERGGMARAIEASLEGQKPGSYDLMVEHLHHMRAAMGGRTVQVPAEYARLVGVWALLKVRGRGVAHRVGIDGLPLSPAFADALGSQVLAKFSGWWRQSGWRRRAEEGIPVSGATGRIGAQRRPGRPRKAGRRMRPSVRDLA